MTIKQQIAKQSLSRLQAGDRLFAVPSGFAFWLGTDGEKELTGWNTLAHLLLEHGELVFLMAETDLRSDEVRVRAELVLLANMPD